MNIQISSDNITVTESMKVLVENKVKKLERIWSEMDQETIHLRVVLNSAPEDQFLVKLDLNLDGETFYTEEPGFELETALIDAIQELIRQYDKKKDKNADWSTQREEKYLTEQELASMSTQEDVYDYSEEAEDDQEY